MRILLDTCDFLWFIAGDASLPATTRQHVQDPANEVFLSVVSVWEIVIKHRLGKLPLPHPPEIYVPAQRERHRIQSLSLDESAVKRLVGLPTLHRDPFDRMLVCQALDQGFCLAVRISDSSESDWPAESERGIHSASLTGSQACCGMNSALRRM